MLAHMQVNFTIPTVVLEHSSLITAITCISQGLSIEFTSQQVSQAALADWSKSPPIQLVTHSTDCGGGTTGGRVYYLVEKAQISGPSTIIASGYQVSIDQALVDVQLVWGNHVPSNNNNGNATTSNLFDTSAAGPTTTPSPFNSNNGNSFVSSSFDTGATGSALTSSSSLNGNGGNEATSGSLGSSLTSSSFSPALVVPQQRLAPLVLVPNQASPRRTCQQVHLSIQVGLAALHQLPAPRVLVLVLAPPLRSLQLPLAEAHPLR